MNGLKVSLHKKKVSPYKGASTKEEHIVSLTVRPDAKSWREGRFLDRLAQALATGFTTLKIDNDGNITSTQRIETILR